MTVRDFLPLASPLMVRVGDEPAVLLAFAVTLTRELAGLIVPPSGGSARLVGIGSIDFPAPVRLADVGSVKAKLT